MNTAIAENTNVQATAAAAEGKVQAIAPVTPIKAQTVNIKDLHLPESPAVVARSDWAGNSYLFLADTQDKENGSLHTWDTSKGKGQIIAVPMAFYKATRPLSTDEEVKAIVQKFSKDTGIKSLTLRKRLYKDTVLAKDAEGKVAAPDVDAVKQQLKDELTNMFNMMMKKIDEAL